MFGLQGRLYEDANCVRKPIVELLCGYLLYFLKLPQELSQEIPKETGCDHFMGYQHYRDGMQHSCPPIRKGS